MKKGFTLVELSIVLVIIGLLIGGILVGQSLIDSANITKIVRETEQYKIAIQSFKNKYKALPGDINHSFTSPGDGDSLIEHPGAGAAGEWTRMWLHLSESGDLTDNYTGAAPENDGATPVSSVVDNGYYSVVSGTVVWGYKPIGTWLNIGDAAPGSAWNANGVMAPAVMASIDAKIDDGDPASGDLIVQPSLSFVPDCLTNVVGASPITDGDYNVTDDTGLCTFVLRVEFE